MVIPVQPNPHVILTMNKTQPSIQQRGLCSFPLNLMNHCSDLNQKNMAEVTLRDCRG